MDGTRFDTVAKVLATSRSRRGTLVTLGGVALVGLLGRSPARADDALKPDGKKCNKDTQCESGKCDQAAGAKHGTCCVGDCTPPSCTLKLLNGPPSQAFFTVQDTDSGLDAIVAPQQDNVDIVAPPVSSGTTDPVTVSVTLIDQSKPADVTIQVIDVAGNVATCSTTVPVPD